MGKSVRDKHGRSLKSTFGSEGCEQHPQGAGKKDRRRNGLQGQEHCLEKKLTQQ